MATHVFGPEARLYYGGINLTGYSTAVAVEYSADALDMSVCGDSTRVMAGGLKSWGLSAEGHYSAAEEADVFADVGGNEYFTVMPNGASPGDRAYMGRANVGSIQEFGAVGEINPFSLTLAGGKGTATVDGTHLLFSGVVGMVTTATTATQSGTGINLGAVDSGQEARFFGHVLDMSGGTSPSITVYLESDATDSWSGSHTIRTAATSISSVGGFTRTGSPATGPITDTWWRIVVLVSGAPSSFSAVVGFSIQ